MSTVVPLNPTPAREGSAAECRALAMTRFADLAEATAREWWATAAESGAWERAAEHARRVAQRQRARA